MILVEEIERLGRAVERQQMTEQEATRQLLKVARLSPESAAEMISDWRAAVARYEEWGRQMVQVTADLLRMEQERLTRSRG